MLPATTAPHRRMVDAFIASPRYRPALPTSASQTPYRGAREAEAGSPSKSLLSGPSKNAATLSASRIMVRPRPRQRGDPTLETTAAGPISACVEAAGEATKTGSGSSKPDILSRHARYAAINRTVPFLRYRYPIAARTCHGASLSYFSKSQLYVERSCVDENCIMGPIKEKTPTPASDVLRDAKDAPLEGLGWIHGFIRRRPCSSSVQCVVLSCARSCRWPTRPSMKWSNAENSPDASF
jgi:hypothetical protein